MKPNTDNMPSAEKKQAFTTQYPDNTYLLQQDETVILSLPDSFPWNWRWNSMIWHPPLVIGTPTHHEMQIHSFFKIIISDVWLIVLLTIQINLLHVYIFLGPILGCHPNMLAITHLHIHGSQSRWTQVINITWRSCGVKTHRVEYIPGRHLPAIVIPTQCIRCVPVKSIHDIA